MSSHLAVFYPAASVQGKYESVEGSAADPGFWEGGLPGGLGSVVVVEERSSRTNLQVLVLVLGPQSP